MTCRSFIDWHAGRIAESPAGPFLMYRPRFLIESVPI
jgi:hypothetical protein